MIVSALVHEIAEIAGLSWRERIAVAAKLDGITQSAAGSPYDLPQPMLSAALKRARRKMRRAAALIDRDRFPGLDRLLAA